MKSGALYRFPLFVYVFIDREAREIMYLVASVRLSVRLSVRPSPLSRLNHLTYDLDIWYVKVKCQKSCFDITATLL